MSRFFFVLLLLLSFSCVPFFYLYFFIFYLSSFHFDSFFFLLAILLECKTSVSQNYVSFIKNLLQNGWIRGEEHSGGERSMKLIENKKIQLTRLRYNENRILILTCELCLFPERSLWPQQSLIRSLLKNPGASFTCLIVHCSQNFYSKKKLFFCQS